MFLKWNIKNIIIIFLIMNHDSEIKFMVMNYYIIINTLGMIDFFNNYIFISKYFTNSTT